MYHVFTDGRDEWVKSKKEALHVVKQWKNEGEKNLRVYKDTGREEDCIFSEGIFPY